jgi:hypothetical protein
MLLKAATIKGHHNAEYVLKQFAINRDPASQIREDQSGRHQAGLLA